MPLCEAGAWGQNRGSRPIDFQSENKTVAARAMDERKTFGNLS